MSGSIADEATTYENATTQNGGGYSELCVGNVGTTTTTRRGFVRYTLPAIPAGATVTRVQLSFTQETVRTMGGGPRTATLELRAVTSTWTEGAGAGMTRSCGGGQVVAGVTWNATPSVAAVVSASAALPSTTPATISFDSDNAGHAGLRDDVQSWVNGTTNDGWRLVVTEEATADNARSIRPGSFMVSFVLADGSSCTTDSDCTNGNCVAANGTDCGGVGGCVCCNAATCTGVCETCQRAGMVGTCAPKAAGASCRTASCAGGIATAAASCNGSSQVCPAAVDTMCTPYLCSGAACGASCSGPGDCAAANICNATDECEPLGDECLQELDDCVPEATCTDPSVIASDFSCMCPSDHDGDGHSSGSGCSEVVDAGMDASTAGAGTGGGSSDEDAGGSNEGDADADAGAGAGARDSGTPGMDAGGEAGRGADGGGGAGAGGAGTRDGGPMAAEDASADASDGGGDPSSSGGCGCRAARGDDALGWISPVAVAVATLLRRRRERR
jgi:hypothetical protein